MKKLSLAHSRRFQVDRIQNTDFAVFECTLHLGRAAEEGCLDTQIPRPRAP